MSELGTRPSASLVSLESFIRGEEEEEEDVDEVRVMVPEEALAAASPSRKRELEVTIMATIIIIMVLHLAVKMLQYFKERDVSAFVSNTQTEHTRRHFTSQVERQGQKPGHSRRPLSASIDMEQRYAKREWIKNKEKKREILRRQGKG
ncbi:hypothetical protein EYF80_027944 [Liparis tanakae]|uniref:Uncharacterized protein n=1 Tax=Liparis tanakae TaxID=230148 RepID=A0A4Z2H7D2_9TELE|nr:hypothetical protein EYF80_027944 [Liparis tanakae]